MSVPRWVLGVAVAWVALVAVWLKVRVEAQRALDTARALEAAGDAEQAAITYGYAIRWYSPGSGPVEEAVQSLTALAQAAEAAGKTDDALRAWRSLRSALFAIRHVSWPYPDALAQANARILALSTAGLAPGDVERHAALLARDPAPKVGWALLATGAFALWVATVFGVARRLLDPHGHFAWRAAAPWLGAFAGTAALWMTGLALA